MLARRLLLAAVAAVISLSSIPARADLSWQPWSADIFARAKAENRFVILDLEAVWCHWCHVMEETTYRDPKVVALLKDKYLTVRVDQDANPDLSSRYGDWGWPATIIFAADGTELAKRRGYIAPEAMASLLEAVIADPTPGPSVVAEDDVTPSHTPLLSKEQRADLAARSRESYDTEHGGWGEVHKFIDADSMDWELALIEKGDKDALKRARQTFDAALNLIDREAGGLYQYSDELDWKSPHYEKIMSYQANGLRQYAAAHQLLNEPRYLAAARDIARYLLGVLKSPEGAFYTSQDADLDAKTPGKTYYAHDRGGTPKARAASARRYQHLCPRKRLGHQRPCCILCGDRRADSAASRRNGRAVDHRQSGSRWRRIQAWRQGPWRAVPRRYAGHGAGRARSLRRNRQAPMARCGGKCRRLHRGELQG